MRTRTATPKRFVTLGMPLDPERAERFRDLAWQQRRSVADLLRELVTEALGQRGIDFRAPEPAQERLETTNATA